MTDSLLDTNSPPALVYFFVLHRFSTLMERAEVMTALRSGGKVEFPEPFEERVPENAKSVRLLFVLSLLLSVLLLLVLMWLLPRIKLLLLLLLQLLLLFFSAAIVVAEDNLLLAVAEDIAGSVAGVVAFVVLLVAPGSTTTAVQSRLLLRLYSCGTATVRGNINRSAAAIVSEQINNLTKI